MENDKTDRRVERTRMALIHAFGSLIHERCNLEQIRIRDVLQRANVGRSTFYEHFRNKDEGLAASLEPFLSGLAGAVDATRSTDELIDSLDGWWGLREQARMIFGGSSRRVVRRLLATAIANHLQRSVLGRSSDRSTLRLAALALAETQVGTLHAWFSGDLPCTSTQVAGMLAHIGRASAGSTGRDSPTGASRPSVTSFAVLTPAIACDALAAVGIVLTPEHVTIEARDERFLARLPQGRLAWFAANEGGRTRLMRERSVLALLAERCTFRAPVVVATDPIGYFDVRTAVPGVSDPSAFRAAVRRDPAIATRIGADLGRILAEQHTRVDASDVAGWLPRRPSWPESRDWIAERLANVVADIGLIASANEVIAAYESVIVPNGDLVLAHTDLGPHNVCVNPASFAVEGIFDYEGAAWTDRHHDFRYLLLGAAEALFESAIASYEPLVGRTIDRNRVRLYNAACAITFLAFRDGRQADEVWCGRTLREDLEWTRRAIAGVTV